MRIDTAKQVYDEQGKGSVKIGPNGSGVGIKAILSGSKTHDWASTVDAANANTTVTVPGAMLGDIVLGCSMSFDIGFPGVILHGYVSATDTVTVTLQNESAGTRDLASGTLTVVVLDIT